MNQEEKIVFGIVGSGWRAECYLQVAKLLPELFEICGVVTRSEIKKVELEKKWGIRVFSSADELLAQTIPDFILTAVSKDAGASVIRELTAKGVAVLAETPPANDLKGLIDLYRSVETKAKLQIAEQYHLQPMHLARRSILQSGRLGAINYANVSISQGYHGISLIRKALSIGFENAIINGFSFELPSIEGPSRNGLPAQEQINFNTNTLAVVNFGKKIGIFEFEKNQHRSWARSQRILLRGVKGEINNNSIKYLKDFRTPIEFDLKRLHAGENENLEGYYLKGIMGGEEWLYRNAFAPARLADEEIALATCLVNMKKYLNDGTEFYNLAEASQDQYLSLMIEESLNKNRALETTTQIWATKLPVSSR
jgi:hypothetical protein